MEQAFIVLHAAAESREMFCFLADDEKISTARRHYMLRRCAGLNSEQAKELTAADFKR